MKPDASHHDPRPEYLRSLIQRAGLSQRQAADRIGISERLLRYYLVAEKHPSYRAAPYPVQFALEKLAED
ncbi:XRE family transcriptional regulator (plasmid) [Xanthomonas citri pv. punicae]|uniref:helix-turn-helix domain-containing protein n=1 Tax=Xanthomonas TaxID=338 RepID=UPI000247D14D|nr:MULTISPECIES: helix-turn-helix transcriptional regulator [Xanthomonas]MBE0317713.1 helix-turn-helix transcriptional regulator [Xanthomonas citri pv. punicae]MBV6690334.1 helix-turn-helix domain-containing protein [Xanthomonas euvesicatoria pv. physalidis]MBV6795863.1 helix-turn-helix domain-containing protein [Xanthomonas campestris pv. daturae]MBV6885956.1 helix-turn-helix domain-containing protein [Xanthomonas campestris pv. euphorbiae]MDS0837733.1 helix-turn-helix domain-containing prote